MNLIHYLDQLNKEDLLLHKSSRRQVFKKMGTVGKKLALASLPIGLTLKPEPAFSAPVQDNVVEVLQFVLMLESLEEKFYLTALACDIFPQIAPNDIPYNIIEAIAFYKTAHINYLQATLADLGAEPIENPEYDFTVGGLFDPLNENGIGKEAAYTQFLAFAQAFEDIGVRAYKGQLLNLQGSEFLTTLLQIHSVAARLAYGARRLHKFKGWIAGNERGEGMPDLTQPVYNGEENVIQAGVDVTTLGEGSPFGIMAATEAYDEPLAKEEVLAYIRLFIKS